MDDNDIKDTLQNEDFAIVSGIGIEFSFLGKSIYIEGRYVYGLNNIYSSNDNQNSKNRVYQLFAGFLL